MAKLVNKKDGRIAEIIEEGTATTKVSIEGVVKELRNVTVKRFWEKVEDDIEDVQEESEEVAAVEEEQSIPEEEDDIVDAVRAGKIDDTPKTKKTATNKSKASKAKPAKEKKEEKPKKVEKPKKEDKPLPVAEVAVGDDLDKVVKELCDYTISKSGGTRQTNSYMGLLATNGKVMIEVHKKTKSNVVTAYVLRQALSELPEDFQTKYAKSIKPCKFSTAINVTEVGVKAVQPIIDLCLENYK